MIQTEYKKVRDQIIAQQVKMAVPRRYYEGAHGLQFATAKFTNAFGSLFRAFALNLCPPVIDAVRDNLEINAFDVESGGDAGSAAWKIWQNNLMDLRSGEIHKAAMRDGDAFAIVSRDTQTDEVRFYPQSAASCTVVYDVEIPGRRLYGAKYWIVEDASDAQKKRVRLTVYYGDRTERFISKQNTDMLPDSIAAFEPFAPEGEESVVQNGVSLVPVFHFANAADLGAFGLPELAGVIPVQDALNKSVCDMLVAMEFSAFRQRWVAGLELELDNEGNPIPPFRGGVDRIWSVDTPDTKFGDFAQTDLTQFLAVKNSFRLDIAMVSGTPLHYFMPVGADFPSGEAIKKAETRFLKRVQNRQLSFGAVWAEAMAYALQLNGATATRLFTKWVSPAELGEAELIDLLARKQDLGIPDEQIWSEAGYGDSDIERFKEIKAESSARAADIFNTGQLPDTQ